MRNLERLDGLDLTPDFNARLAVIKDLWPRYLEAMSLEAAEGGDRIFALSEQMLEVADSLTLFATRLSGIPEAHYVNVAGRNRMLSQRIAKFFLFREWPKLQETIAGLSPQVCAEFESNLSELVQAADRQPELWPSWRWWPSSGRSSFAPCAPTCRTPARPSMHAWFLPRASACWCCVDTSVKLFERLMK